jgi:hypothetical protein
MRLASQALLVITCAGTACGGASGVSPPGAASGSGEFYAHSYVPVRGSETGAYYDRKVTFTQTTCTSTRVGPCSVNPCAFPSVPDGGTEPLPDAGSVSIDGAQMRPLTLEPQSDGTYAPIAVDGQLAWTTGGSTVTFQWAHLPGNTSAAGGSITLSTPPYIALATGSAFADATPTVTRSQDLTVSWTSDSPPTTADQVAVDLNVGSTQVVCIFSLSDGTGVVPTGALSLLGAGAGTFNVHSKQGKTLKGVDGTQWTLGFNVDAEARTSYGLAMGAVTIQ